MLGIMAARMRRARRRAGLADLRGGRFTDRLLTFPAGELADSGHRGGRSGAAANRMDKSRLARLRSSGEPVLAWSCAITPWNYPLHQAVAKVSAAPAARMQRSCSSQVMLAPLDARSQLAECLLPGPRSSCRRLQPGDGLRTDRRRGALAGHPKVDFSCPSRDRARATSADHGTQPPPTGEGCVALELGGEVRDRGARRRVRPRRGDHPRSIRAACTFLERHAARCNLLRASRG